MTPFFGTVIGASLAQGDLLDDCPVPAYGPDFGSGPYEMPFRTGRLIVISQSCDLENRKVPLVALCPVFDIAKLAAADAKISRSKELENLRKGRYEALHMLASPENPAENRTALVVDFRQIFSLPFDVLEMHASRLGDRWRPNSPFVEHFSQAFARFFMRVGLPSSIPEFK